MSKSITLYHIGGYELLRDGTQKEKVKSLEELQESLNGVELTFDSSITDMDVLADSIEEAWANMYDDGGGSGWIERN